jgi:hypothetical protein
MEAKGAAKSQSRSALYAETAATIEGHRPSDSKSNLGPEN